MFLLLHLTQGVVALMCVALGGTALIGVRPARSFGLARRAVRWPVGVLLLVGGLGLLGGLIVPLLTFFAAALDTVVLLGLLVTAVVRMASGRGRGGWPVLALATLMLVVAGVGAVQPLGLQVLLLPAADQLPYEPVAAAHVVKTYGPGMWFEGIGRGPDGTLYLAESKGEDYTTGDKSEVHAEVIARAADGSERIFFSLPTGSTAGVMAIGEDGTVYLAVTGNRRGLWRITSRGEGRLLAPLPADSFPNGVTFGPNGQVYVADSSGTIWRVDPTTGATERAYQGSVLQARPYVALPPGANGIHLFRGQMYVTNSDAGRLLRFTINPDGTLSRPQVVVRGVPADDFAIDTDGTIYLTTHIYNTLVRVDPTGRRTVIANSNQHIVGATDCVITTAADGTKTLYAVTDGGALATGTTDAAGTLVALTIPSA